MPSWRVIDWVKMAVDERDIAMVGGEQPAAAPSPGGPRPLHDIHGSPG